jgi:hypothetical protein
VLANDEHAAALVTIRGERAGKQQLNENEVLIYHFRDGKVSTALSVQGGIGQGILCPATGLRQRF